MKKIILNKPRIILGNWKMNMTKSEIISFCSKFNLLLKKDSKIIKSKTIIGIAPPTIGAETFVSKINPRVKTMGQHISFEQNGAYTGSTSCRLFKDIDVKHSLIGHSETREQLFVTDKQINKTIKVMLENKMTPIFCIGESTKQYKKKQTASVLKKQISLALKDIRSIGASQVVIAYEPIWAIGKITASVEVIENTTEVIRKILTSLYGSAISKKINVLYGGSVKDTNAASILNIKGVDGVLVGGASMDPTVFYNIVKASLVFVKNK